MGKPRIQARGTGCMTDILYHLKKKPIALVNRQGGFEGVFHFGNTSAFIRSYELQLVFAVAQDCENLFIMVLNSNRLFSQKEKSAT